MNIGILDANMAEEDSEKGISKVPSGFLKVMESAIVRIAAVMGALGLISLIALNSVDFVRSIASLPDRVADIEEEVASIRTTVSKPGPVGPAGPQGEPGPAGLRGEPGEDGASVSEQAVREMISAAVTKEIGAQFALQYDGSSNTVTINGNSNGNTVVNGSVSNSSIGNSSNTYYTDEYATYSLTEFIVEPSYLLSLANYSTTDCITPKQFSQLSSIYNGLTICDTNGEYQGHFITVFSNVLYLMSLDEEYVFCVFEEDCNLGRQIYKLPRIRLLGYSARERSYRFRSADG